MPSEPVDASSRGCHRSVHRHVRGESKYQPQSPTKDQQDGPSVKGRDVDGHPFVCLFSCAVHCNVRVEIVNSPHFQITEMVVPKWYFGCF